jgi:hypothetical protein
MDFDRYFWMAACPKQRVWGQSKLALRTAKHIWSIRTCNYFQAEPAERELSVSVEATRRRHHWRDAKNHMKLHVEITIS